MFDPIVGRWTTTDPKEFEAGDANLYRDVHNDPTNLTDPSGLQAAKNGPRLLLVPHPEPISRNAGQTIDIRVHYVDFNKQISIDHVHKLLTDVAGASYRAWQDIERLKAAYAVRDNPQFFSKDLSQIDVQVQRWFAGVSSKGRGTSLTPIQLDAVATVFKKVADGLRSRDGIFVDSTTLDDAVAAALLPNHIQLGARFWKKPDRQQAGALFHELTHLFAKTTDHSTTGDGAGRDYWYIYERYQPIGAGRDTPFYDDPPQFKVLDAKKKTYIPGSHALIPGSLIQLADAYQGFLEEYYLTHLNSVYEPHHQRNITP